MMPVLLALPMLFASCDKDDDSNPTLDLSHVSEGFVLNTPAYAENNTYDLARSESVNLTCSQPNYGGNVPYVVDYYVQVSLDQSFTQGNADAQFKELSTSYPKANMQVSGSELNSAVVDLYLAAHPDESTVPAVLPIYIRLRAVINGSADLHLGETYSNFITLPKVHAEYTAPDVTYPDNLFVIGSSIQNPWTDWKVVPHLSNSKSSYMTIIYVPDNANFKWGDAKGNYLDYTNLRSVNDMAEAGITCNTDDYNNIKVAKGGWYTLLFQAEISADGKKMFYDLTVYPAEVYLIGNVNDGVWEFNDSFKLTAPADASGQWVSPAFLAGGELRASVKIPGFAWYDSEFTLLKGSLFFANPKDSWEKDFGADYAVKCTAGQKLYIDFDKWTGEVK